MATGYKIQMAYPTQNKYYDMDIADTKQKANKKITSMKKEGYAGMKFRLKKIHIPNVKKYDRFLK